MTSSGAGAVASVNFAFLAGHDPLLVRLVAQAEGYVFTDPETALFKLRAWVEALAKQIAGSARLADAGVPDLLALLRRLTDKGYLPREVADLLHTIRSAGNRAVHDQGRSKFDPVIVPTACSGWIWTWPSVALEAMHAYRRHALLAVDHRPPSDGTR